MTPTSSRRPSSSRTEKGARTNVLAVLAAASVATFVFVGAAAAADAPAGTIDTGKLWTKHCQSCHGPDGKGKTKAGKKLNVRDYTDPKVQAEMKDDAMIKATTDGIFDKGGKEKMKAYKDELSTDEIKELVAYIRKFKS